MNPNSRSQAFRVRPLEGDAARIVRDAALAFLGACLLTLSAKAQIPFYPVPMTLQTLAVLMLGASYGAPLAAATVALYLAEGLVGLPVFAGIAAGPAYMAGPTGGFLIGFLVAAALVGVLTARGWGRSPIMLIGAMALGHATIFALGFAWLAFLVGAEKAWIVGVAPFALATLVKTGLAAALTGVLPSLAQPTARGLR